MWEPTEDSYRSFVAQIGPRLRHAYIARYGPDVGSDVTADALAYCWEHWRSVCAKDNPAGWIYRVGQSRSRRYFRKPVAMPAPHNSGRIPEVEPGLSRGLEQLSDKQRVAVLMVHAWGYTVRETAEILGVSASTVQRNADRGLTHLRERLGVATHA